MSQRDIRLDVDLSIDRSQPVGAIADGTRNVPYKSFTIVSISAGASVEVGAGQGAPFFPYQQGGLWIVDDPCDSVKDGIWLRHTAQPGATMIVQLGAAGVIGGLR